MDIEAIRRVRRAAPRRPAKERERPGVLTAASGAFMFVLVAGGGWLSVEAVGLKLSPPAPTAAYEGAVTEILDGDTFYLTSAPARIHLWGLDAPEAETQGGAEATRALAAIALGKRLSCDQVNRGAGRRIIARCRLPSGEDVAALMIKRGAAREYLVSSKGYYALRGIRRRQDG